MLAPLRVLRQQALIPHRGSSSLLSYYSTATTTPSHPPSPKDSVALFTDLQAPSSSGSGGGGLAGDVPPSAPPGSYPANGPPGPNPNNPITQATARKGDYTLPARPRYRLHCHSTRNNTIMTFTQPNGEVISWFSGGSCKFKGVNRNTYEAGYQCAVRVFKSIEDKMDPKVDKKSAPDLEVDVFFKGFGQGREALQRALTSTEGEKVRPRVVSMTDRTAIKIGGTRAQKVRRL